MVDSVQMFNETCLLLDIITNVVWVGVHARSGPRALPPAVFLRLNKHDFTTTETWLFRCFVVVGSEIGPLIEIIGKSGVLDSIQI